MTPRPRQPTSTTDRRSSSFAAVTSSTRPATTSAISSATQSSTPTSSPRIFARETGEGYQHFVATGEWPNAVQIPAKPEFLRTFDDGTTDIDWRYARTRARICCSNDARSSRSQDDRVTGRGDAVRPIRARPVTVSPVPETGPLDYPSRSLPYVEDSGAVSPLRDRPGPPISGCSRSEFLVPACSDPAAQKSFRYDRGSAHPRRRTRACSHDRARVAPSFDTSGRGRAAAMTTMRRVAAHHRRPARSGMMSRGDAVHATRGRSDHQRGSASGTRNLWQRPAPDPGRGTGSSTHRRATLVYVSRP